MSLMTRWRRSVGLGLQRCTARSRVGWIGVDIGSATIKIAQVERTSAGWNLIASRIVPVPDDCPIDAGQLANGAFAEWLQPHLQSHSGFVGRAVACSVPMSVASVQSFDLPPGTDDELRQMIVQEFVSAGEAQADEREFAYWKLDQHTGERQEVSPVTVLSVPQDVALGVGTGLSRSRWSCRVLDGLPFAMARAVTLASGSETQRPQAAIDWGYATPLFVIVQHGRPVFARILRDRGLKTLLETLSKRLQLSAAECRELLIAYGQAPAVAHASSSSAGDILSQLATQPIQDFTREVLKTLQYLKQRHPDMVPARMWLMGGGSLLSRATESLKAATGIETHLWKLSSGKRTNPGETPTLQPLLASAIALSQLGVAG